MCAETPADPKDEALAGFLASPVPRTAPPSILRGAYRQGTPIILGIFGAIFALVGSSIGYQIFPWRIWEDWQLQAADTRRAPGIVRSASYTGVTVGGGKHQPGHPVYRYDFTFSPDGQELSGVCYTTFQQWSHGQRVWVNYRPGLCCIAGARLSVGDGASAFVGLFPMMGLGLVGTVLYSRRRARRILRDGELGEYVLTGVKETRVKNGSILTVSLSPASGPAGPLTLKVQRPQLVKFIKARHDDNINVFVLVDPKSRRQALFPEAF